MLLVLALRFPATRRHLRPALAPPAQRRDAGQHTVWGCTADQATAEDERAIPMEWVLRAGAAYPVTRQHDRPRQRGACRQPPPPTDVLMIDPQSRHSRSGRLSAPALRPHARTEAPTRCRSPATRLNRGLRPGRGSPQSGQACDAREPGCPRCDGAGIPSNCLQPKHIRYLTSWPRSPSGTSPMRCIVLCEARKTHSPWRRARGPGPEGRAHGRGHRDHRRDAG